MASINYSLSKRNTRVALRNQDGTTVKVNGVIQYETKPKWFARVQVKGVLKDDEFIKYCISHYGSVYGIVDLRCCMEKLQDHLIEMLVQGKSIELDNLGVFRAALKSKGVEDATTFNAELHIVKAYANWAKCNKMKKLNVTEFNRVSTIALRSAAIQHDAQGRSEAGFATVSLSTSTLNASGSAMSGVSGGSVDGFGKYTLGDSVTIEAYPAEGFTFVGWRHPGSNTNVSTDATYEFTLQENTTLVAVFQEQDD